MKKVKRKHLLEQNERLNLETKTLREELLSKHPAIAGMRQEFEARMVVWLDDRLDNRLAQRSEELGRLVATLRENKAITDNLNKFYLFLIDMSGKIARLQEYNKKLDEMLHMAGSQLYKVNMANMGAGPQFPLKKTAKKTMRRRKK